MRLCFGLTVTKGVWNVIRLQTMDRDTSSEMLNARSMNLFVSAQPSYLYIPNFQIQSSIYNNISTQQNYKLSISMNFPTCFSDKPPFPDRRLYK